MRNQVRTTVAAMAVHHVKRSSDVVHVFGPGNSIAELVATESQLGMAIPSQLWEFYRRCNGEGDSNASGTGALFGLRLLSLQQLVTEADFIRHVRVGNDGGPGFVPDRQEGVRVIPLTRQEGPEQYAIDVQEGRIWLLAGFSTTQKAESWLDVMALALQWH